MASTRSSVVSLYKRLVHLGREYPDVSTNCLAKKKVFRPQHFITTHQLILTYEMYWFVCQKPEVLLRRIHDAFMRNKDLSDPEQIQQCLEKGDYIAKELEALYMLRKYRTMKSRYYD